MKKLMFVVMALVAMSVASCTGRGAATETETDTVAVDSVEVAVDTVAVDSVEVADVVEVAE